MVNLLWIYIPPREKSNFPDPFVHAWQKGGGGGGGGERMDSRDLLQFILYRLYHPKRYFHKPLLWKLSDGTVIKFCTPDPSRWKSLASRLNTR